MSKEKPFPFETHLKRSLYGEQVEITALSDDEAKYWIVPRKFSVDGVDAYSIYQFRLRKSIKKDATKLIVEKMKSENVTADKVLATLSEDELAQVMDNIPDDSSTRKDLYRIFFRYGIGRHNLVGEESERVSEELIERLCESNAAAIEIFGAINEFNGFFSQPRTEQK